LTVTIDGAPAPADQDPATGRYVVAAIDSTAYPEGASLALVATAVDNRDNVATSTIHVNVNNSDAGLVTGTVVKHRVDGATVSAGNTRLSSRRVVADNTRPVITVSGLPAGDPGYTNESVTPVVSIDDAHVDAASVSIELDGAPLAPGTVVSAERPGEPYVLDVTAADLAGPDYTGPRRSPGVYARRRSSTSAARRRAPCWPTALPWRGR
jgi:hypothetical protein